MTTPNGWLLYDDDCGMCHTSVARWLWYLQRHGIVPVPSAHPWAKTQLAQKGIDVSNPTGPREIRLLLANQQLIGGVEVILTLAALTPGCRPLVALAKLPGIFQCLQWGYRQVAQNRQRISGVCGLRPSANRIAAPHPEQLPDLLAP